MNITTTPLNASADQAETAAHRFPLIPRSGPSCPPLPVRLDQIRTRANAARRHGPQALLSAAQAHNLAALTASDCGLAGLARGLCIRQASLFLAVPPFDAATAKLALQPMVNLGRLANRDNQGTQAHQLFTHLFEAATSRTTTVIDGVAVAFADLTVTADDHREVVRWLWSVLLADGTRALARAGHWADALDHIHRHHVLGRRLLDGRQTAILARSAASDHHLAQTMLAESECPTPWEKSVATVLTVLCRSRAGHRTDEAAVLMVDCYLDGGGPDDVSGAFRTRLGLSTLDLATEPRDRRRVTDALIREALATEDAYGARDILGDPVAVALIDAGPERRLRSLVRAASLGTGTLADEPHADLMESVRVSETALKDLLCGDHGSLR